MGGKAWGTVREGWVKPTVAVGKSSEQENLGFVAKKVVVDDGLLSALVLVKDSTFGIRRISEEKLKRV